MYASLPRGRRPRSAACGIPAVSKVQLWYNISGGGEDTHHKKHGPPASRKGMTPIEKNIRVVDENGNEYEATYPKRAKGLVKNGRARFLSSDTICLICPPDSENDDLEDINMSENTEMQTPVLTIEYLLAKIDEIAKQTEYLNTAIERLGQIKTGCGPGDVAGEAQAHAIGDVVRCRETTNQQLLKLYEKMYDDLKPKESERLAALNRLSNLIAGSGNFSGDTDDLRHILNMF